MYTPDMTNDDEDSFPLGSHALATEKARLRDRFRARLADLAADDALDAGRRATRRITDWSCWSSFGSIAIFAARADEIATSPLVAAARTDGKRVLFPRVCDRQRLSFCVVEDPEELRPGRFEIEEPASWCAEVPVSEIDLVFVPGLAFDRAGGRLGRGAGYYDRALGTEGMRRTGTRQRPVTIGMGFRFQVIAQVPMGPADVRLTGLLTEDELLVCE